MTEDVSSSTHPPLPPTTEDDRIDRLRLLRSRRVGPATYRRLMAEHGSAAKALSALPEIARDAGIDGYEPCPKPVVLSELKAARAAGARLIFEGEAAYPTPLYDIDDAPITLWASGDVTQFAKPMVAIVGARNASSLGLRMAKQLSRDLAEAGYCVVSGLARGIDTAAHEAALSGGTIAVMPGGVDHIYPAENEGLARKIEKGGLRLSDQPMGLKPMARHFIARNRIISGLARAVIVVEAAAKSGSLSTARVALDQGRDVLAVPGHPFDPRSAGCNMVLRDGAVLVRNAQDVIDHLGAPTAEPRAPELPLAAPLPSGAAAGDLGADVVLAQLTHEPTPEDRLIRALGRPTADVVSVIVDLELDGRIVRSAGGMLARAV